ncbi:helix-turn-helix domain-containing protein [Bacillus marinisedimentorum]|uniref:helix-turn-helix domain-containing protein n=1 Tax=Bacillus marinisedimentorum TaxID=1821260 RepID=UPI0008722436|nr:helix-turn-helix domain-containing protein [Bacillus marinisedimentorum]
MHTRHFLLLYCLNAFRNERTIYGTYHLLKGKKTSQTIQDAKLFALDFLFGVLPEVDRNIFEQDIASLFASGFISHPGEGRSSLTEDGKRMLNASLSRNPFPAGLNGWRFHASAGPFWQRFSLMVQVLSHLMAGMKGYIPVAAKEEHQSWVKQSLPAGGPERKKYLDGLYKEISMQLEAHSSDIDASIFTMRLSGARRYGLTLRQIAEKLGKDEEEVRLRFQGTLHRILLKAEEDISSYPLLHSFIPVRADGLTLTKTARRTWDLINAGKSIDEAAAIRRLKRSTIEDHIVELALNVPDFSIDLFVPDKIRVSIGQMIAAAETRKLRELKELAGDAAGYFEIRLILAKEEALHGSK